jgi:hypothetical protein
MPRERSERERDTWIVERAIVLQLLRDDHAERWSRAELAREIADFDAKTLSCALARLKREEVVCVDGAGVRAARAVRHLDALEMVCI